MEIISRNIKFILGVVYIKPDANIECFLEQFNNEIEMIESKYPSYPLIVGGDFNARIANLNQLQEEILPINVTAFSHRENLDTTLNKRGRELVRCMEENGFIVLNGRFPGDHLGQYTYILDKRKSTIDLVWASLNAIPEIKDFEVLQVVSGSDHFPVIIKLHKKWKNMQ